MGTFGTEHGALETTTVRVVLPVFDVVEYDGDNALAVAEFLARKGVQTDVRFTEDSRPALISYDGSTIPIHSYIGVGFGSSNQIGNHRGSIVAFPVDQLKAHGELAHHGIERWPA